jgi:hypothetical protein
LFDLFEQITDATARAAFVRMMRAYLDGLAQTVGDDAALLRETAVAYGRLSDLLAADDDAAGARECQHRSLELFTALAAALPDNAQARRDLEAVQKRWQESVSP